MNNLKLNFFNGLAVTAVTAALLMLPVMVAETLSPADAYQNAVATIQDLNVSLHS